MSDHELPLEWPVPEESPGAPEPFDAEGMYDERESVVERVDRYADLVLEEPEPEAALERRPHHVVAVLVSHDGARWLSPVLSTLSALESSPEVIVAVDTGSTDGTADVLRESLGPLAVVDLERAAAFGAAVAAGIARADELIARGEATGPDEGDIEWVWILHDDCAPDPWALQALLDASDTAPGAAVIGPKVLGWHDRRLLLEAGVSVSASGRRATGLERGERDQGQHDGVRDVLSVGSAGMLVRRDAWDQLGGFDPDIALFREDLDFGWRATEAGHRVLVATDAVVHHAEAGIHGRRPLDAVHGDARRADRESALHVLLAHAPAWALPLALLRLVIGSIARSIGFLLAKAPDEAGDEIAALLSVLTHPGRISRGRALAARTRVDTSSVRSLRPHVGTQVRHAVEATVGVITGSGAVGGGAAAGPSEDEAFDPAFDEQSSGSWLRRPAPVLALALAAVSLLAVRSWFGSGVLQGGALLPAPSGVGDLWATFAEGWHDVGPGAATPAPPYLMSLWAVGVALLGSATRAVDAVLMLGIPLAGVSMYLALRRVVASRTVRAVAGAAYGLLPAAIVAVTTGRLGTMAFLVLLPALVRVALRVPVSWRAAWGGALLLAVMSSFVPLTWLVAVVLAAAAIAWASVLPALAVADSSAGQVLRGEERAVATAPVPWDFRSRPVLLRLATFALVPLALLLPWTLELLAHPSAWFLEAGLPGPVDPGLAPVSVALLHPGGPGSTPWWFTAGLLALALAGLVRRVSRPVATIAWVLAVVGLGLGVLQSLVTVTPASESLPVAPWPGPATVLAGFALIVAGACAADGVSSRLAGQAFSWRQPAVVVAIVAAALAPVASGAWFAWHGVGQSTVRDDVAVVPAFVAAQSSGPDRPRSLVLRAATTGVDYALIDGDGPRLGAAETGPPAAAYGQLDALVADLVAGRGGAEIDGLGRYAVRFVVLSGSAPELVRVLDAEPGLRRISSSEGDVLWRLDATDARLRAQRELGRPIPIPAGDASGAIAAATTLPDGIAKGAGLLLAERADRSWRATLDGADLAPADDPVDGWRQSWSLPSTTGTLRLWFDQEPRHRWLWLEGTLLAIVVVLALPGLRRPEEDPDADVAGEDELVPTAGGAR